MSGADEGQDILSSRCAGLSRSIVTESVRPFREIVKNLLLRLAIMRLGRGTNGRLNQLMCHIVEGHLNLSRE